jgi:hypothetical protein
MKEIQKRKDQQVGKQWRCLPVCGAGKDWSGDYTTFRVPGPESRLTMMLIGRRVIAHL